MDPRDPICERLGDLAATSAPGEERHPDARQWALIDQKLDRGSWRNLRRLWPAVALSAVAAVGVVAWLVERSPLDYRVHGCRTVQDGARCSTAEGTVTFSDGTHVALDPQTQVRIAPLAFGRGAEIELDDGNATLAVRHRQNARWAVLAGPFRVEVTGTRFSVGWSKMRQDLNVAVTEGEVHVSGGNLEHATVLRPGQTLQASARTEQPSPRAAQPSPQAEQAGPAAQPADQEDGTQPQQPRDATTRTRAVASTSPKTDTSGDEASRRLGNRRAASTGPTTPRRQSMTALPSQAAAGVREPGTPGRRTVERELEPMFQPRFQPRFDDGTANAWEQRLPNPIAPISVPSTRVVIAPDGHLSGAMTGSTWLVRGDGTNLSAPASREAFVRLVPDANGVCGSGTVAGLRCVNENTPNARCNWDTNWGVAIGFNVRADEQAWGQDAPKRIAVEFHGRSTSYRLNAHRKGDPGPKNYCIDDYRSGVLVTPSMFKSRCWAGEGETLPSFDDVNVFNLEFSAGMQYVAFHYCISGIRVER